MARFIEKIGTSSWRVKLTRRLSTYQYFLPFPKQKYSPYNSPTTPIPGKINMNASRCRREQTKRPRVQTLSDGIAMLQCRRYVTNLALPLSNKLSKEVATDITVRIVGSGYRAFRQNVRPLIIFLYRGTQKIPVGEIETSDIPHEKRLSKTRGHRYIRCLLRRERNGLLLPRPHRHTGTRAHDNPTRDKTFGHVLRARRPRPRTTPDDFHYPDPAET